MKPGSLNLFFYVFLILFNTQYLVAQEKINLQDIQPTFEEEADIQDYENDTKVPKIKSKEKNLSNTTQTVVNLRALDKITARTSDMNILIGKKRDLDI